MLTKKNIRLTFVVMFIILIIYFFWLVRASLYPFIVGLLLAYILNPIVCYLEGKGLPRLWSIIVTYSVVFSVIILGSSHLVPILVRDLESFGKELPLITAKFEELLFVFQAKYQNSVLPHSLRIAIDNSILEIENGIQAVVSRTTGAIIDLIGRGVGLAIAPILAFYLLHDLKEIKEKIILLFPARWRPDFILICKDVNKVLGGVILGQITIAAIVGVLVSIGLYFLDVPFALLIGILAGLLDVIPYFGAFIGAAPAVTMALLDSPLLALKVILLFFVIHQLEGSVIGPKILGEKVGLHPLTVIFFVIAGGQLFGVVGMLLGVPAAAVGKVFMQHFLKILL